STMMVGLAIGVAVIGVIASIATGFTGYLDRTLGADYIVLPRSLLLSGGNQGAGPDLAERIARTQGIAAVTTLRVGASQAPGGPLQVIGIDPASYPAVGGLDFTQGDATQAYPALARGRAVILNPLLALQLKAAPGDTVTLKTPEGDRAYAVAGIGVDYINAKLATGYISQADLARDFHETSDVLVMANAAPNADRGVLRAALDAIVGGYPALTLYDSATLRASQARILDAVVRGINVLLLVFAIPGLIAMVNTLAINVLERTRELGVMRAIGTTRGQIGRMIVGESFLLASVGVAFGILAGLWLSYVMVLGTNVIFPTTYSFPLAGVLATIAIGLIFGVVAALLPARQAARRPIVAALRYE
ncbi:MAG TPA: FtsX-like permease family protein, partial [Candidatus Limnocylindria bacterium]